MTKGAKKSHADSSPFFFGEYEHAVDSQRRVAIPSAWRTSGESRFILFPGRNSSVMLVPFESFSEFLNKARKVSLANRKAQEALARLGSRVSECKCDKQGRIQIPQRMLDILEIKDQAVLVGAISNAQIWSPENWSKKQGSDETYLDEVQKIDESPDDFMSLLQDTFGKMRD